MVLRIAVLASLLTLGLPRGATGQGAPEAEGLPTSSPPLPPPWRNCTDPSNGTLIANCTDLYDLGRSSYHPLPSPLGQPGQPGAGWSVGAVATLAAAVLLAGVAVGYGIVKRRGRSSRGFSSLPRHTKRGGGGGGGGGFTRLSSSPPMLELSALPAGASTFSGAVPSHSAPKASGSFRTVPSLTVDTPGLLDHSRLSIGSDSFEPWPSPSAQPRRVWQQPTVTMLDAENLADAAADFLAMELSPNPPQPATVLEERPSSSASGQDEAEPMELESLAGPVLAVNPWMPLLEGQQGGAGDVFLAQPGNAAAGSFGPPGTAPLGSSASLGHGVVQPQEQSAGGGAGSPAPPRQGSTEPAYHADVEIKPEDIVIAKRPDGSDWELGAGAFGKVYKAFIDGVTPVAVKVLGAASTPGPHGSAGGPAAEAELRREAAMLCSVRDPHVVAFLGACLTPGGGPAMLVTELMEGGDLRTALSRRDGAFRWAGGRGRGVALDVARGLHALHRRGIVHFDLKSPNILLGRDGTAKIGDVGLAAAIATGRQYVQSDIGVRGSWAWVAPEVLVGARRCSEKADMFSFGVVLWELVTGELPRRGQMRDARVPEECPQAVSALIDACLCSDPHARPSAKEAFAALRDAA